MNKILDILCEKKIEHIKIIDMKNIQVLFDYFVIGTSSSLNQSLACVDELEKLSIINHVESDEKGDWILIDCGLIIIHLFSESKRKEIDLEYLWKDMPIDTFECK
ncbi:MAG: ribosome silencing factor [Desulfurella sp.]|jgi:ribosome-associated protein|uniref:Ribosome-associated protein n=1 Tax=Desulfurella multipotens TaxID=79269 RepID=A0A1G6HRH3_9BACT|nr:MULTISPECIES: ribosome silencing factor [Desulfurella]AHF97357.1 ribosome-associated protein IOJAP [Desulfurella acetivorans A63]HEX13356.1 ribosome silencing factor [Desulfurella acetivorans]PMP65718.1 MAG: ribosome silencing factor RsfS [Desulfurella multipotens]PMP89317.1 MAG: ribosome silencing factor RsfS [Desulfurella sp.]SDB96774.1 ribosome-associated protein [Desulfurella multipotens]